MHLFIYLLIFYITDIALHAKTAPLEIKDYLYKQLLLPSIEYCSVIWDPHHSTSIYKLEMIQHRAARFVLNKPWLRSAQQENSSVTDMLTYLK